jgi:SOS-response transcriptional repressor LexA
MSALAFQTARKAQYLVMQVALPGRPKANAGVLLLDPANDSLHVKLRSDWTELAGAEDIEVLEQLQADLESRSRELGAEALLRELEDSLSHSVLVSERASVAVGDFEKALARLYARHVEGEAATPVREIRSGTHLPLYSLRAAAGSFGEDMEAEAEGWVRAPEGMAPGTGVFVAQVVGRSMEPLIPEGSLCVFRHDVVGTRQGKLLLIQRKGASDAGGEFTVKRYTSVKSQTEEGWRHERIRLEPLNPDYEAWDLVPSDFEDGPYRVCGEFLRVVPFEEQ